MPQPLWRALLQPRTLLAFAAALLLISGAEKAVRRRPGGLRR